MPRWATARSPGRATFGPAIAAVAERLGQPLMPWQRLVADVGGEINPETGLPAYRDVVVTVPRQSGKTTLILAWEIQRALGWGRPQRIVYSAQTGNDARKKLIEDQIPILEPRKSKLGIRRILKGMGNEAVEFRNGSRVVLMASGEEAGHGKTVDLGVKDEFFADIDDRRDQALGPAMITRADAQKLTASTAGTDASVPLNRLVKQGRQAVERGDRTGIAYFEWSAPEDADQDDPDVWWGCMPALGFTMTEEAVRHERDVTFAGKPGEFRRAYLNLRTTSDERVIPAPTWATVCDADAAPTGDLTFAADIHPERLWSSITAADGAVVELIDRRPGTGWLLERMKELNRRHGDPFWGVDGRATAPVGSMVRGMREAGLTVVEVGEDITSACNFLFDAIVDATIRFRTHDDFDDAVAALARRYSGDTFVWDRRHSADDITPIYAATVAHWVASGNAAPNIH